MIFKILGFRFFGLVLGQVAPCENTEGLIQCESDCTEDYVECLE